MIPLRIQRWWSLKSFIDRGVDHFAGSTRDERHFHFLQCYWSHRLTGCSHKSSLMLARMELRMLVSRFRVLQETRRAYQALKQVLDASRGLDRIDRVIGEIEAKHNAYGDSR